MLKNLIFRFNEYCQKCELGIDVLISKKNCYYEYLFLNYCENNLQES